MKGFAIHQGRFVINLKSLFTQKAELPDTHRRCHIQDLHKQPYDYLIRMLVMRKFNEANF
jgi:hypothetical protein